VSQQKEKKVNPPPSCVLLPEGRGPAPRAALASAAAGEAASRRASERAAGSWLASGPRFAPPNGGFCFTQACCLEIVTEHECGLPIMFSCLLFFNKKNPIPLTDDR